MTKLWNISGQKPTFAMQSQIPETQTCLSEDVPTNCQTERDIATEVPIRMNVSLPSCSVVLRHLTEEEINQRYPDPPTPDYYGQSNSDLSSNSEDSFYTAFEKHRKRRRLRDLNKPDNGVYEQYKQQREHFINRRSRFSDFPDGSSNMSQDEFKNSSKGKKRVKKVKKYEQDSEWSPYAEKSTSAPYGKRLRRHVRRPVIESDTSSTDDEEDLLYHYYKYEYDYEPNSNDSAFQNAVPFDTNDNASSKSDSKGTEENALSDSNLTGQCLNSSQSVDSKHNSDILSGIMKEMDACKRGSSKLKVSSTVKQTAPQIKPKQPRGRKRLKSSNASESDVNSVVTNIIQEMVNTVSRQHKHLEMEKRGHKRLYKKCKWCHTQFPTSNADEAMCAICYDQGKGKYLTSPLNKNNNQSVKEKPLRIKKQATGNKVGKKVNNTMSRVLKILPKTEMQRLMYSEKNGKLSNEKGYNHCRRLSTLNDDVANNSAKISLEGNDVQSVNSYETVSADKKARGRPKKVKISESAENHTSVRTANSAEDTVACENITKNGNKRALKNFEDGLFLIDFPGPDVSGSKSVNIQNDELEKSSRYNSSRATTSLEKAISSNESKTSNQFTKDDQYQTYLLPPIPTVLIANYSSNSDNGNYRLSSIFYQNEYTQQHSVNISASAISPNLTVTPALPSCSNSNKITSSAPIVLNNSSLSISKISLDKGLNPTQPCMNNESPLLNSLQTSSLNGISLLPVVSSVVSLRGKNVDQVSMENGDFFTNNNFVNSEQLQIKITSVASGNTCNQVSTEESNSFLTDCENDQLHSLAASYKSRCENIPENTLQNESSMVPDKLVSPNLDSNKSPEDAAKQSLDTNGHTDDASHDTPGKQPSKPKDAINTAIDLLGAISILAVIDLDKSPRAGLNIQIQMARTQLAKLNSEKNAGPEHSARIASCQYNLELLDTANKFLNLYGSFAKVSDFLLRKHRMIQIKKEMLDEDEEDEDGNQNSCRFSQNSQSTSSLSNPDLNTPNLSPVIAKNCDLQASINHIQKLQSQIAAMNNTQLTISNANFTPQYDIPNSGTVHHFAGEQYAALTPATGAPALVTPRNEYMGGDSRETPSRGSGPRTPARPESATSQPDEIAITAQIKKELMEVATSLPSQCAYSQNTTLTPISNQMQTMQDMSSLNVGHSISNNIVQQIVGNDPGNRMYQSRAPPSYNFPNYSNVLLNMAKPQQVPPNIGLNTAVDQNGQLLIRHQLYLNEAALQQKQAVPSINNQQYIAQPSFSNASTLAGTVLVNSSQVRNQNVNALLTNVSNQQFYTSSQVPQMYCPPQPQLTSMAGGSISSPTLTITQNQKTYWHQKHKMECKPMPS